MLRTTVIASIVLLASTAAMAVLPSPPIGFLGAWQAQSSVGALANTVLMEHGTFGQNMVSLNINNKQEAEDILHIKAGQTQDTYLMQVADACADCGIVGVDQALGAIGAQYQAIGSGIGPKAQGQGTVLEGVQTIAKSDGQGTGNAMQVGKVDSLQQGQNASGQVAQKSGIDSWQLSTYNGKPGDVGLVTSSVTAATEQEQLVMN